MKDASIECWAGWLPVRTLFLSQDAVRSGDVLLTRGGHKGSSWIAWGSNGKYSHAALFMTRDCLLESREDGVGYTHLLVDRLEEFADRKDILPGVPVCFTNVRTLSALVDPDGNVATNAVVLRPPFTQTSGDDRRNRHIDLATNDALATIAMKYLGRDYPQSISLLAAANRPFLQSTVAKSIAQLVDRLNKVPELPGPYCSQLVALVLAEYTMDQAAHQRAVEAVNPNDFLTFKGFTKVRNAIVRADPKAKLRKDPFTQQLNKLKSNRGLRWVPTALKNQELLRQALEELRSFFESLDLPR